MEQSSFVGLIVMYPLDSVVFTITKYDSSMQRYHVQSHDRKSDYWFDQYALEAEIAAGNLLVMIPVWLPYSRPVGSDVTRMTRTDYDDAWITAC